MGGITVPGWVGVLVESLVIMVGKPRTATKSVFVLYVDGKVDTPTEITAVGMGGVRAPAGAPEGGFPFRGWAVGIAEAPRVPPLVGPIPTSLVADFRLFSFSESPMTVPQATATGT